MLKHIYKGLVMMVLVILTACSADTFTEEIPATGDSPILLNGTATRAIADEKGDLTALTGYTGALKLSAKYETSFYFSNQSLTIGTEDGTENQLTTTMRYPAGDKTICLFAHTGEIKSGNLTLKSGAEAGNDILLSNGEEDNAGQGTPGSSKTSNALLLTFHHVMTKVRVEIAPTSDTDLKDPQPSDIKITLGKGQDNKDLLPAQGQLAITSNLSTTTEATNLTGSYSLQLGDNYLVPTGKELSGNIISGLIIDDYTATSGDCNKLSISDLDDGKGKLTLSPGLSYTLTLKIKRLKVESIAVSMKQWDATKGEADWGYNPYKVALQFEGGYDNTTDAAKINKIVLKHKSASGSSAYQYVGGVGKDDNIDFVTLPTGAAADNLTADLYTKNGLLITGIKPKSYTAPNGSTAGTLGMSLGANGMNKDATDTYYEVTTPLQFYNLMSNPTAEEYHLIENIDMNSLPLTLTPPNFPAGAILDGNSKQIMHLNLTGSGLINENKGTLKNIHITSGIITSNANFTGGLCGTNSGTIEACINEADITTTNTSSTAGGICGKNTSIILACLNTGNIESGNIIGGICGTNENTTAGAITGCINAGMLNKNATNLGGICGSSTETTNTVVNTCYWLTGTARKVQQTSNEVAIGDEKANINQSADLAPDKLRDEAVANINKVITDWEFKWEKDSTTGTYPCVWPIPVKK